MKIVSIQQASIPIYRLSFFKALNMKFHIKLFYGKNNIPSVEPLGIDNKFYLYFEKKIGPFYIKWHSAQLAAINKESDLAILSWDIQYLSLWIALIKNLFYQKPIIFWGHGFSKHESKMKFLLRMIPVYFSNAIILYDHVTAERLKKIKGFEKKVFVAPNSIDQVKIEQARDKWINHPDQLLEFKITNQIHQSFNIIYIGRIYEENNLEILLKSLILLINEGVSIKLIVIGKINDYVKGLQNLIFENNLLDHVVWVGELYEEEEIAPWMLSSNIFCYPSNIGLSIMHAYGYGLPVLTDDNFLGHNPEIWSLVNGFNGLTYSMGDHIDLANKIVFLKDNFYLREKLSYNSLNTVREKFNLVTMVEGFECAIKFALK